MAVQLDPLGTPPDGTAELTLEFHGLSDDAILSYLARSWPLDETDRRYALNAAHILLRRERAAGAGAADG